MLSCHGNNNEDNKNIIILKWQYNIIIGLDKDERKKITNKIIEDKGKVLIK